MDKEISKKRRVSIIWKRVVSLLVIVAMMVCYVPSDMFGIENISVVEAATTYNASAAAIYGQTYTNASGGTDVGSYNKQYKYYQGNDCANFVSQCLVAGGLQTDGTWYAYSRAWIRADYLLEWFRAKSEWAMPHGISYRFILLLKMWLNCYLTLLNTMCFSGIL